MQTFFKYLAYFVTVIYFVLGLYLIFQEKFTIIMDQSYSTIFGLCLIFYSIYRAYTIYQKYYFEKDSDEE
ncbi:MAG TPA: hypothetical protein PLI27_03520 [Ignavibacteriales bacterium]|nr:hypothetical protein [Ignavibacteriales bacterium]HOL80655.1 hypothetical protein [Ignavibacteriales bacterium]HOM64343.1 hypothetical protein [Ignavibacteriales bacterium]HPD67131.1 hypothetical protein [Ignavibacteriales bacterium]HPP33012.1 hypothetical protein [Ignavibacteriales bacterium]